MGSLLEIMASGLSTHAAFDCLATIERRDAISLPLFHPIVGNRWVGMCWKRRLPLKTKCLAIALLCCTLVCNAQDVNLAKELTFKDIFGSKRDDARTYILLGGGWIRTIFFGNPGQFISTWLEKHPAATVTSISHMFVTDTLYEHTREIVYIWAEDGEASLNVDLVRAGVYPGGVMFDMVDNLKGLNELLKDPKLADTKAQIDKERAEAPQDKTERLVSEEDYERRMHLIEVAESQAREAKLGIWSDTMKAEREEEGYPQ
jgi:hypothetical protein